MTPTEQDVLTRTDDFVKANYAWARLNRTSEQPIYLRHGWRIVYESFLFNHIRVRRSMVILYCDDDSIEVEYDEVKQHKRFLSEEQNQQILRETDAPPLEQAIQDLRKKMPDQNLDDKIVRYELVIDTDAEQRDQTMVGWRFDIITGDENDPLQMEHITAFSAYNRFDWTRIETHIPQKGRVMRNFDTRKYGRIDLNRPARSLNIKIDLSLEDADIFDITRILEMRSELLVWYCRCHAAAFLQEILTVRKFNYDLLKVHFFNTFDNGPSVEAVMTFAGPSPVLHFPYDTTNLSCWAEDPSIIFHELGHAMLYLLYTKIQNFDHEEELGIEEGFCDYFASILMENMQVEDFATKGIGAFVPEFLKQRHKGSLPRPIGLLLALDPLDTEGMRYATGTRWTNFLWQARALLLGITGDLKQADRVILYAHIKPRFPKVPDEENKEGRQLIWEYYQHSLWHTAVIDVGADAMEPVKFAWDQLLLAHPSPRL